MTISREHPVATGSSLRTSGVSGARSAGIAEGERARRDFDTYLTGHPRFRNQCWQAADHTELAIRVLLPDRRVVSPWATLFLDVYSRASGGLAAARWRRARRFIPRRPPPAGSQMPYTLAAPATLWCAASAATSHGHTRDRHHLPPLQPPGAG